ncbi:MAG: magnesium transporter CorA family protein [Patescibacteria group bacterium UBA2163]
MINRYQYNELVWIDIESPTAGDIEEIANEFDLGPLLIEELLTPTAKPRTDMYPDFVYTVLHFPAMRYTHGLETDHEIDIILGSKFMITAHYSTASATYDLARTFEATTLLHRTSKKINVGHIFLELAQRLYQAADNELDALEGVTADIEDNIFDGKEREMVTAISYTHRELLTHKRLISTHHDSLQVLEKATRTLFGETYAHQIRAAVALHYRVYNRVLTMHDILNELRETNMALLYTRQNEIMKNLTIIAFITFPLTLLAAVFGMNTVGTPLVDHPQGFWIIVTGMAILTFLFFAYFKAKKWF